MGKYDQVIGSLPPAPIEDLEYQAKVEAAKIPFTVDTETGEVLETPPSFLAEAYAGLRRQAAKMEAERYELQVKITALEQLLAKTWENDADDWGSYGAGDNTIRMKDGSAVHVEQVPEGKVVDKEAFRRWCAAPADICMTCGGVAEWLEHQESIPAEFNDAEFKHHPFKPGGGLEKKLQLWPSTMNAIAKERTFAGAPPPDGVEVYARTTVKFRKE